MREPTFADRLELMRLVCRYLRDRYADESPVRVDELAQASGLSRAAFSRRFKRIMGIPPATLLKELQARQAIRLIRRGLNRTQAAYRAGFGTRRTLYRHVNSPPARRRKSTK